MGTRASLVPLLGLGVLIVGVEACGDRGAGNASVSADQARIANVLRNTHPTPEDGVSPLFQLPPPLEAWPEPLGEDPQVAPPREEFEYEALRARITQLERLVADLEGDVALCRQQVAVDASVRSFAELPDAALLQDEEGSNFVLTLLHDFPGIVLEPYEATQLYERFRDGSEAWRGWSPSDPFRAKIEMLGLERILAEVEPDEAEWIQEYWDATADDG